MADLHELFNLLVTQQDKPIPNTSQVQNSAGGYSWGVDDWKRLQRFLILGSEKGTFYIAPAQLTAENATAVLRCIASDGQRVVREIVAISDSGRAHKQDPTLFALALCTAVGDEATKRAAFAALPAVARIGTHLFHFLAYAKTMRGWGRGLRTAINQWYAGKSAEQLAYQLLKYRQRDGWSHRDVLRLAHPTAPTDQHQALYYWAVNGWDGVGVDPHPDEALRQIWAFERVNRATSADEVISLIEQYRLSWEMLPTMWLGNPSVWRALLPNMPMTALLRNLGRMTANGALQPMSAEVGSICNRLSDSQALKKARIHPLSILVGMNTYSQGHGERGSTRWTPIPTLIDALDGAFYHTFQNVEPTQKRWLLGLDVSGSMRVQLATGISARTASAALALITAATENDYHIMGFSHQFIPLAISPKQRLDDVVNYIDRLGFGNTDCSLPMVWATQNRIPVDCFAIYTDSETWAGPIHPSQALREYRQKMGIPAKLIVVGMASNGFTIADPDDAGMLDVVGFDTAVPQMMANFACES